MQQRNVSISQCGIYTNAQSRSLNSSLRSKIAFVLKSTLIPCPNTFKKYLQLKLTPKTGLRSRRRSHHILPLLRLQSYDPHNHQHPPHRPRRSSRLLRRNQVHLDRILLPSRWYCLRGHSPCHDPDLTQRRGSEYGPPRLVVLLCACLCGNELLGGCCHGAWDGYIGGRLEGGCLDFIGECRRCIFAECLLSIPCEFASSFCAVPGAHPDHQPRSHTYYSPSRSAKPPVS